MIKTFESSLKEMSTLFPHREFLTVARVREEEAVRRSVSVLNELCHGFFQLRWPDIELCWGIEVDDHPNAGIDYCEGVWYVALTTGAIHHIDGVCRFFTSDGWVQKNLYPYFFSAGQAPALSETDLANYLRMLSLAVLFSHEIGHGLDMFYIEATEAHDVMTAEEISADGHAILAGLTLTDVLVRELAAPGISNEALGGFLAVFLLLSNALLDDIVLDEDWRVDEGVTHPPGLQRLVGATLHVSEHVGSDEGHFGLLALPIVVRALYAMNGVGDVSDDEVLQSVVDAYDRDPQLISEQYERLQRTLKERTSAKKA